MKQTTIFTLLASMLAFTSCMEKDVYDPGRQKEDNKPELDLSFKFAMKSLKTVSISATDAFGNSGKNVLFSIYQENPLTDEGISHDAEPLYTGYTNEQGILCVDIALPEDIKQVYVYPVTAGFGVMQQVNVEDHISCAFQGVPFPQATTTRTALEQG